MVRKVALLCILGAVLAACQSVPWQKQGPPPVVEPVDPATPYVAPDVAASGLQLSPDQRFKDIPLPVGLREDMERTFVYQSSTLQVGRMVYTSRASVTDLTNFFIAQCPTAQWELKDVLEAGGKSLVYTKPGKRLVVLVQSLGFAKGRRVIITMTPEGGSIL